LIFGVLLLPSFSQTYSGKLINADNDEAVPFANIGVVDRNIGTVSDLEGRFIIELGSQYAKDSLRISCIGFSDRQFLVSSFIEEAGSSRQMQIKLDPKSYQLDEVIIEPGKTRSYTLGYPCDSNSAYGNAFYSTELGTEMGVVITIPGNEDEAYLKKLRFYVGEFTFGSFPVRINIYNLKDGLPHENILRESIVIEINSVGAYILDLGQYNITTTGDFFVSLEYYRVPDIAEGKLVFCAVHTSKRHKGDSYFRWTSQGNWQREMFDHMGLSVEVVCRKH